MKKWISAVAAALLISACATPKTAKKGGPEEGGEKVAVSTEPATAPSVDVSEANLRGSEFNETPELKNVHFEYDGYALNDAARATLKANAEYLKEHKNLEVLAAGHCDERGTIQYNLALGQKRAKAVRDYYTRIGISGKSVATVSYGKEKPICGESTEDCWSKNRRSETRVRARAVSKPTEKKSSSAPPQ